MFGGVFSWSNVLYERVYPGGDLLIQFVGRDAYKQFWNFSKDEKENLATQLAIELPALRGKVGASQEEIASAVGISRQTYSAYENRTRPIPWSLYLALLFYFDYIPSTHYMIRQLELFPNELDECWLAGRVLLRKKMSEYSQQIKGILIISDGSSKTWHRNKAASALWRDPKYSELSSEMTQIANLSKQY